MRLPGLLFLALGLASPLLAVDWRPRSGHAINQPLARSESALGGVQESLRSENASPLTRLADAATAEIVRVAQGKPVEVLPPEDRTGRSGLGRDLHDLIVNRLGSRTVLSETGARLRVAPVLAEAPGRLLFTARVTEEPEGRLRDVLSLSVPVDAALLSLVPLAHAASLPGVDVVASSRTPPLEAPVLALALLGERDLVVLSSDNIALYRIDHGDLALLARTPLPERSEAVRRPGGLLHSAEKDSVWALTSARPGARLFAMERSRLVARGDAAVLPWPGSRHGLAFRAGTNLIEGSVRGLGDGPFLMLDSPEGGVAVSPEGRLTWAGESLESPRVGPTLAGLWTGVIVTSTAAPPGEADALMLLERGASGPRVMGQLPMEGSVRAVASHRREAGARLVAAVEETPGATHLVVMDLVPAGN